jgi:putative ABC transport system ATP-binding protein
MATAEPPILKTRDLGKRVPSPEGPLDILRDVSLDIAAGERVAVAGESGSGKSTLLGLMAGLDLPTRGQVWLDGQDLGRLDEDGRARLRGRLLGFVFQSFQLIPSLTAIENVMLPLELAGRPDAEEQARGTLDRVGLASRLHHYPSQLSGGEQQRVAIARAFAPRPRVLFADEPTGSLDRRTGAQISDLLFSLNREHATTLVLVTHDPGLAARCDRTVRLDAGRLVTPE